MVTSSIVAVQRLHGCVTDNLFHRAPISFPSGMSEHYHSKNGKEFKTALGFARTINNISTVSAMTLEYATVL